MRTKIILLLSLVLAGCSQEDETIETVNSFDTATIQKQLVGRWVYYANAYSPKPNELIPVPDYWMGLPTVAIDTLTFMNDMTYYQSYEYATFQGTYDFTQSFLSLYHGPMLDVFKYSFDNINTLRLGTGKGFSTFKIYRRE